MGDSDGGLARPGRRGRQRWQLITGGVAVGLVVLAAGTVIAYRVLAPAEVSTPAGYYPPAPGVGPGPVAKLTAAPLIVDGRLRVYATTRQVRADGPIDALTQVTPAWSFRRWPEQLVGVAAVGAVVASRWSDGELVVLDARTGEVTWRTAGPVPDQTGYAGRRTGARTVYTPTGLHTATTSDDGRSILLVRGGPELRGIALATGRELWRVALDGEDCRGEGFSTTGGHFAVVNSCAPAPSIEFYELSTGELVEQWRPDGAGPGLAVEPLDCAAARSDCAGLRTTGAGQSRGWLVDGPGPVAAPALDPVNAWLVDGNAIRSAPGGVEVTAHTARTAERRWRWRAPGPSVGWPASRDTEPGAEDGDPGRGAAGQSGDAWPDGGTGHRVIMVQPGRVHLLTPARELITLDSGTGAELSRFVLARPKEQTDWVPGRVYALGGFVAIERLRLPVDPEADDGAYYRFSDTVILAAT